MTQWLRFSRQRNVEFPRKRYVVKSRTGQERISASLAKRGAVAKERIEIQRGRHYNCDMFPLGTSHWLPLWKGEGDKTMAGNSAYNLARFEPREPRQKPALRVVKNTKKLPNKSIAVFKAVCCAVLVLTIASLSIYNQVVLSELGSQISEYNEQLVVLKSEEVRLQALLESQGSMRSLEQYATSELGLSKIERYQVTYIDMQESDQIIREETEEDIGFWERAGEIKDSVLEYLNLK